MANQTLLRAPFPLGKWGGFLLGLVVSALTFYIWWCSLNPTQQHYFAPYRNATAWSMVPKVGDSHFVTVDTRPSPAPIVERILRTRVYDSYSLPEMLIWPTGLSALWLVIGLILGDQFDRKRILAFRNGRKVRGWDVLTEKQYNKQTKGDGFVLLIE